MLSRVRVGCSRHTGYVAKWFDPELFSIPLTGSGLTGSRAGHSTGPGVKPEELPQFVMIEAEENRDAADFQTAPLPEGFFCSGGQRFCTKTVGI